MNRTVSIWKFICILIVLTLIGCVASKNRTPSAEKAKTYNISDMNRLAAISERPILIEGSNEDEDEAIMTKEGYNTNNDIYAAIDAIGDLTEFAASTGRDKKADVVVIYRNHDPEPGKPTRALFRYWIKVTKKMSFGVTVRDLRQDEYNLANGEKGVCVYRVIGNTPAYRANILKGDIITFVNGESVINAKEFVAIVARNAGKPFNVRLYRNGTQMTIEFSN